VTAGPGSRLGPALCAAADLLEGVPRAAEAAGPDGPLELVLLRSAGRATAYRNRCPHRGTPLDWVPGRFLSADGALLQCATHGARFRFEDGLCVAGPCRGERLVPVPVAEAGGEIRLTAESQ
jgi:nitrite reductase/ring-hydroxylating ferredoxin subunit